MFRRSWENSATHLHVDVAGCLTVTFCLRGVSAVFTVFVTEDSRCAAKLTPVTLSSDCSGGALKGWGRPTVCDVLTAAFVGCACWPVQIRRPASTDPTTTK